VQLTIERTRRRHWVRKVPRRAYFRLLTR